MKFPRATTFYGRLQRHLRLKLHKMAFNLSHRLAGDDYHMAPRDSVRIAGCVVFYIEEDGMRQFVTLRTSDADGLLRFPSFFGLLPDHDAAETAQAAVQIQLGSIFFKAIDKNLLAADRILAAPTFCWQDEALTAKTPVQLLVWAVRLVPDQLSMIQTGSGLQLEIMPEFALLGKRMSRSHQLIFKTIQNRLGRGAVQAEVAKLMDNLEISGIPSDRTIH